jgi:hypothetical protein
MNIFQMQGVAFTYTKQKINSFINRDATYDLSAYLVLDVKFSNGTWISYLLWLARLMLY